MSDEIDEVVRFPDWERAVAAALSECAPGEIVVIHAADCKAQPDGNGCDCEPMELTVGAKA